MKYSIHASSTGETLIKSIELDEQQVASLSSETPEGHFCANEIEELSEELGSRSVYAILH